MSVIDPDYATLNPSSRKQGLKERAYYPVLKNLYLELIGNHSLVLDYSTGFLTIKRKRRIKQKVKSGWWIFSKEKIEEKIQVFPALSLVAVIDGIVIGVTDKEFKTRQLAVRIKRILENKYKVDNVGITEYF